METITIVQPTAETAQDLLAQLRDLADMYQADLDTVREGDAGIVDLDGMDVLLCELAGYTVDLHTGELTAVPCVSSKWIGDDMVLASRSTDRRRRQVLPGGIPVVGTVDSATGNVSFYGQ